MKFHFNLLILFIVISIFASCQPESSTAIFKGSFKLEISATDSKSKAVIFKTVNAFNYQDSIIKTYELDSLGELLIEEKLALPLRAFVEIEDKSYSVYLSPGDDLQLKIINKGEEVVYHYSGKGSAVNNYLLQSDSIHQELIEGNGNIIFRLNPTDFNARIDSIRMALQQFHKAYSDTVNLPENIRKSLALRDRINLIGLKLSNDLANYDENENLNLGREKNTSVNYDTSYFTIPFEPALLEDELTKDLYAQSLALYLTLNIAWPAFNMLDVKDGYVNDSIPQADIFPYITSQMLKKTKLPHNVKEFLTAKEVYANLQSNGISTSSDSLINDFKRNYKDSKYLADIQKEYTRRLSIIPGKPAPDFMGLTPEGDQVLLSDFKGKVVYLDFWATWCGPCVQQFPHAKILEEAYEENDEVVFLYVSMDRDKEKWQEMVKAKNLSGIHIIDVEKDEKSAWQKYLLTGVPQYILIDQSGLIVNENPPIPSSGKVKAEIDKLLKQG
ncbi:MAG: hypothetical protein CMO01_30060 [Thalassobius sp.]|nr:hypothetical protein [Thalassovita sp.]